MNSNSAPDEQQRTILLVDDHRQVAEAREAHLTEAGYRVVLAHSVVSACEALANHLFDAVILDWMLADGTGQEILSLVKRDLPWLPCIVHSAFQSSDGQATAAGATDFVMKGDDPDELLLSLARALQKAATLSTDWNAEILNATEFQYAGLVTQHFDLPDHPTVPICIRLGSRFDFAAVRPVLRYWSRTSLTTIVDCRDFDSPESARTALFGRVERIEARVTRIVPGALERRKHALTVLRHVSALSEVIRHELRSTFQSRSIVRWGSNSEIPMHSRLVLTVEVGPSNLQDEHRAWFGSTGWHDLERRVSAASAMSKFSGELFRLPAFAGTRFGRAAREELRSLPEGISVSDVLNSLEKWEDKDDKAKELDDLGLPILENRIVDRDSGDLCSLSEARSEMERYYLRRVFSACKGNVQQAAEVAGVKRQMIYNYIRKYDFDMQQFCD